MVDEYNIEEDLMEIEGGKGLKGYQCLTNIICGEVSFDDADNGRVECGFESDGFQEECNPLAELFGGEPCGFLVNEIGRAHV